MEIHSYRAPSLEEGSGTEFTFNLLPHRKQSQIHEQLHHVESFTISVCNTASGRWVACGVTQTVLFSAPCKVIAPWSHSSYIPSTPTQQPGLAQILSLTLLASPCVLPLARDKAKALPLLCSKAGKPIFHYFARSRKEKAN